MLTAPFTKEPINIYFFGGCMVDVIISFLISALLGMGIGGALASFFEGGGPQRIAQKSSKTIESGGRSICLWK